jgi:hypothetical protein
MLSARSEMAGREAMAARFGGIQAEGTKFVCAVGSGPDDLSGRATIPTGTPGEAIRLAIEFFQVVARDQSACGKMEMRNVVQP